MRKVVLIVVVGLVLVGAFLPATGLPLFVPVLVSLGLIGTGVVLRRRTRESF